jgi:hypothetical protein
MHFKKTLPARDTMSHIWRWQKTVSPTSSLKVTQAVSSRLYEEQLQELQPLFAQDKVMIGKLEVLQKIDKIFKSSTSRAMIRE